MTVYKMYRKSKVQPMRPYICGEDLDGISVSPSDTLEEGGMIAVNPDKLEDKWYVAKDFFEENYDLDSDVLYFEGPIEVGDMNTEGVFDLGSYTLEEGDNG